MRYVCEAHVKQINNGSYLICRETERWPTQNSVGPAFISTLRFHLGAVYGESVPNNCAILIKSLLSNRKHKER
jgi:hypothetical protein